MHVYNTYVQLDEKMSVTNKLEKFSGHRNSGKTIVSLARRSVSA